jgi:hypothetical protein
MRLPDRHLVEEWLTKGHEVAMLGKLRLNGSAIRDSELSRPDPYRAPTVDRSTTATPSRGSSQTFFLRIPTRTGMHRLPPQFRRSSSGKRRPWA